MRPILQSVLQPIVGNVSDPTAWPYSGAIRIIGLLPAGFLDTPYIATLLVDGGTPPYTISNAVLPAGLSADIDGDTITVSGTPTEDWNEDAIIGVEDSGESSVSRPIPLSIIQPPSFTWKYDISDVSSLRQNTNGTTAVTADGDPVGYVTDLSGNGYHLIAVSDSARPVYRTDGVLHWLEVDGSADAMQSAASLQVQLPSFASVSVYREENNSALGLLSISTNATNHFSLTQLATGGRVQAALRNTARGQVLAQSPVDSGSIGPHIYEMQSVVGTTVVRADGGLVGSIANSWGPSDGFGSAARVRLGGPAAGLAVKHLFYGSLGLVGVDATPYLAYIRNWLRVRNGLAAMYADTWDVFSIAGQSNAIGIGDSSTSPIPEMWSAAEYRNSGYAFPLRDPMQSSTTTFSTTGSAWPSFSSEYLSATGRKVMFVGAAANGVGVTTPSGGWAGNPIHVASLVAKTKSAISFIQSLGGTANLVGVMFAGGESDANAEVSIADYKAGLASTLDAIRSGLYVAGLPMFVLSLDNSTDPAFDGYYAAIRQAQIEVCDEIDGMHLVMPYQEFEVDGRLTDAVHWNQGALNQAGEISGASTAAIVGS